jgi:hypothetical protein
MRRHFSILAMSLLAGLWCHPTSAAEPSAHSLLIGTWRHQTFKHFADGTLVRSRDTPDGSSMQFKSDGTWVFASPRQKSSGTYRWLDDARIETTIVQSELAAQIGFIGVKRVGVDAKSLKIAVIYDENAMKAFQPRADGTRPKEMVVLTTFDRVTGE